MAAKSEINIAIVAIAYLLMIGADFIESTPFYYLFCMFIHLVIMVLCSMAKGLLIKCYGVINAFPLFLYFPYVFFDYAVTKSLMWEGAINFANIILIIELIIISNGVFNGLSHVSSHWRVNAWRWNSNYIFFNTWISK